MKVLESTQTEGPAFQVRGGQYQLVCGYGTTTVKLQVQKPESDPAEWIDTNQEFTADGVKAFWLSSEDTYRVINAAAGGEAWLSPLQYVTIRGRI